MTGIETCSQVLCRILILGHAFAAISCTGPVVPDAPRAATTAAFATEGDDLYLDWSNRVPSEDAEAVALLSSERGPGGSIYGVHFADERDYSVYLAERAGALSALMLDASGDRIVEQAIRANGTRITFFPTGDTFDIERIEAGFRVSLLLTATLPASRIELLVDEQGQWTLADSDVSSTSNPGYGTAGSSIDKGVDVSLPQITKEECVAALGFVQKAVDLACNLLDKTADIAISEGCKSALQVIKDLEELGVLSVEEARRLAAGLNLACKGAALIKNGGKFFKKLTPFGWTCFILETSEELSQFTTGQSLAENICSVLGGPPCPPGQVLDDTGVCLCTNGFRPLPDGTCDCPPGQVRNPLNGGICACPGGGVTGVDGNCECPPGQIRDDGERCVCPGGVSPGPDGACCPAGGFFDALSQSCECPDGSTPDPARGCPCPDPKTERDPQSGECACKEMMVLDPETGKCECPEGLFDVGDDEDRCLPCDAAELVLRDRCILFDIAREELENCTTSPCFRRFREDVQRHLDFLSDVSCKMGRDGCPPPNAPGCFDLVNRMHARCADSFAF